MMLMLTGSSPRYCDGFRRRSFLQAGSLAVGGLALPQLLQAEQTSARGRSHRAVIMLYLSGGLAHQDTFDPKPLAPQEVRGEFTTISTTVPGIEFSELLPGLAQTADKLSVLRSVTGQRDEHTSFQNLTGHRMRDALREGYPNFGSVIAKTRGSTDPVVPPFVDLFPTMRHRFYNSIGAGYLGGSYHQVRADGEDLASMKLRYIEPPRFGSRQQLLGALDRFHRSADQFGSGDVDENYRRAFEVLTSSQIVDALDVEKENPKLRERYGRGSSNHLGDGAPLWNDQLLIARRLIEAGVRVVTVAYGFWDTHGNNFGHLKQHLPTFDTGVSALIEDIHDRGLAEDVTIVVWGEFGRTPRINNRAGRDHWAPVQSVILSGGGMNVGRVIGSTDSNAAYVASRPVDYRDVLATVYHNLGIDPHDYIRDVNERPVRIMPEACRPIPELVG